MDAFKFFVRKKGVRWAGAIFIALLALLVLSFAKPTHAENERVITIYHDGTQQTIVTDATTVGDALKRANLTINDRDLVEPATSTKLIAPSYDVNVYRARPVTIVDGSNVVQVLSAHTSARQIAADAGITMYDEDSYTLSRIDDFVVDGGVGLKLTIQRATPINFTLYGKTVVIRTLSKTVGDLLKDKNVILGDQDGTNVPLSTPITNGMTVQVWRNGAQTITQEEGIPFPVRQVRDVDHQVGWQQIQQPGINGKKVVTYQVTTMNGAEVARKEIQSVVVQNPSEQVVAVGARAPMGNITAQKASFMGAAGIAQSDWGFVDYVVTHESNWNVASTSSNGCKGLGQACPGSKLVSACPNWDVDPVCQLQYFSAYANKYGGWQGAYNFKVAHGWW